MADLVRLAIVANEQEAELALGYLRSEGVDVIYRVTDLAFGSGGELPASGAGPRELLVRAEDLDAARQLLAELD